MSVTGTPPEWRKATASQPSENCVEVKLDAVVGVRDTKDRAGGQLAVQATTWQAAINQLRQA